jgi:hypothetical protein
LFAAILMQKLRPDRHISCLRSDQGYTMLNYGSPRPLGFALARLVCLWIFGRPWVRYEILKSFKRGNHLFGVHINSIKGKDGLTKTSGPNPLSYVGVTFSESGLTATLWELIGDKWFEYDKIDGSASYQVQVSQEYRGKGFNLADWYHIYEWNSDNGFANFSTWLK